jgi:hypothetical protein
LMSDPSNCGSCSNSCSYSFFGPWMTAATCSAGVCVQSCEALMGYVACGNTCVNLQTDDNNCGSCGNQCPAGSSGCVNGTCGCSVGYTQCNDGIYYGPIGSCVDTRTDSSNCGSCGNQCQPSAPLCNDGVCSAQCTASGLVLCGGYSPFPGVEGSCVDPQTDANNCGACGVVCTGSLVCQAGQCVCPPGHLSCAGNCVDPMSANDNCGQCGTRCIAGKSCAGGKCQ